MGIGERRLVKGDETYSLAMAVICASWSLDLLRLRSRRGEVLFAWYRRDMVRWELL